jgi:hypothetical protein
MKLISYVIREALLAGDYIGAVNYLLGNWEISLPHAEHHTRILHDIGMGMRVWLDGDPYEWYEGDFLYPKVITGRDYSGLEIIPVTIWLPERNTMKIDE